MVAYYYIVCYNVYIKQYTININNNMEYTKQRELTWYFFEIKYTKDNTTRYKAVRYRTTASKVQKDLYNWVIDNEKYNDVTVDTYNSYLDQNDHDIEMDDYGNSWVTVKQLA